MTTGTFPSRIVVEKDLFGAPWLAVGKPDVVGAFPEVAVGHSLAGIGLPRLGGQDGIVKIVGPRLIGWLGERWESTGSSEFAVFTHTIR